MKKTWLIVAFLSLLLGYAKSDTLTLQLTGMTPHVGQLFEVRLLDINERREVGRDRVESVPSADFSVSISGLEMNHSYLIDFYADLNGSGYYDPPPTDHAWRLELNNVEGDTTVTFSHNTNFTDIPWRYLFKLDLTGMTPHLTQLFELRLINVDNGIEVGRARVDSIPAAEFSVTTRLLRSRSYNIDFYADLNGNGLYDQPPADHAWRLELQNVEGDTTLTFSHNTNFTDISWQYIAGLKLTGMTPHIGQMLEGRLVDLADGMEVIRGRINSIRVSDFKVRLRHLMIGHSYYFDFYADFNENGVYDPPPTDHAWRLLLENVTGDTMLTFGHNTNFIDIEWPEPLGIGSQIFTVIPNDFSLYQNYPNPFNPITNLRYDLPATSDVTFTIYDILGRKVRTLVRGVEEPGFKSVMWDATDDVRKPVSAGVYLYRIQAGDFTQTRKMILLR